MTNDDYELNRILSHELAKLNRLNDTQKLYEFESNMISLLYRKDASIQKATALSHPTILAQTVSGSIKDQDKKPTHCSLPQHRRSEIQVREDSYDNLLIESDFKFPGAETMSYQTRKMSVQVSSKQNN